MGKSQRSADGGARAPRLKFRDPDVPVSGCVLPTKLQLECPRCGRCCTYDRPQWFNARELRRQAALKKEGMDTRWVTNPETVRAPLSEIDLPRCPCGEQYVTISTKQHPKTGAPDPDAVVFTSAFPKRRDAVGQTQGGATLAELPENA